ncbi:MAG: type II secretion system protein GspL [Planctomycetota bacterium]
MKPHRYYLRAMGSSWSLYGLSDRGLDGPIQPLASDLDQKDIVRQLGELASNGSKATSAQLVLGVPSSWCLCAAVSEEGLPKGSAAQQSGALQYRLEAQLPITAESCAIGFVGPGPGRLGLALDGGRLQALVHALEDAGHSVEAIAPRAMLAAQFWVEYQNPDRVQEAMSFCWLEDDDPGRSAACQLMHFDPGAPPRWRVLDTPSNLQQQLKIDGLSLPDQKRAWYAVPDTLTPWHDATGQTAIAEPLSSVVEAEIQNAQAIVSGATQPWVNLNGGPLAPRHQWRRLRWPAFASVAALVVLLLSVMSVLWLRADAYNQIAEQHDQQAAQAFSQALPGQAIPTSPQRRLQAKLKQLRGESGLAGGDALEAGSAPTLVLLHDLLDALPSDQRYAITDLRIEQGELRMTGYARTHGEADQIANTMRGSSLFVVEPPSTDNLREGGVRFALQATHRPPPPESPENPEEQEQPAKPRPEEPSTKPPSLADRAQQGGGR